MTIALGIDTGGTYTDAVVLRDETQVLASAKSLTTRHNLALGIGRAVQKVLEISALDAADIKLVSLSTTLATNALVEKKGGRIALIFIGFSKRDLTRQDLQTALGDDPVVFLSGGHDHTGSEAAPLDLAALEQALENLPDVSGFAIVGQFATRNPAHERAARDFIRQHTGAPCSCSFELSAKLGGPKRALTAVFNARLIGMIDQLITRAQDHLDSIGIDAPLMVVRGDGALIDAQEAKRKPIETILSGPAASIVGAKWLCDQHDAIVSDIGGTTTDVAILQNGEPKIDPDGASVGGFRTMVEAVAIQTFGLGGDSQVHLHLERLNAGLELGPRRVMPIALLAHQFDHLVHSQLDLQLSQPNVAEFAGRFLLRLGGDAYGLSKRDLAVLDRVGDQPASFGNIIQSRVELASLERLIARGLVMESGITPSDAAHHLGQLQSWDQSAASKALQLLARHRDGSGDVIAKDSDELAQRIIDQLTYQTVQILLQVGFGEDGISGDPKALAGHPLTQAALGGHRGAIKLNLSLDRPLIGLGASAANYYPAVADRLETVAQVPQYAGVANAIGAIVGQITMRESGKIEAASNGVFRAFHHDGPRDYSTFDQALSALRKELETRAGARAKSAGGDGIVTRFEHSKSEAEIDGRKELIAASLMAIATARPRIAR